MSRAFLFFLTMAFVWGGFALAGSASASARTELVMMEEHGCPWCEKWQQEIGVVYGKTAEGQRAPLRRVDVHRPLPADLKYLKLAYFTPTFILVSDGREIGRIQGYPGEDFFWALLQELLEKLPAEAGLPLKVEAHQ